MMLNQYGANIPYPYHDLPLVSTHDRLGYLALLGIKESMDKNMGDTPPPPDGKGGTTIILDCGKPPEKKDRRK